MLINHNPISVMIIMQIIVAKGPHPELLLVLVFEYDDRDPIKPQIGFRD